MICDLRFTSGLKRVAFGLFSFFLLAPFSLLAQGSLTPPGAPAATMKTLTQIEPRSPIAAAPVTISQPGSYYLTANISVTTNNAITITTSGVALDLNGFAITSTAPNANGTAILLAGNLKNISIANGFVRSGVSNNNGSFYGAGFYEGVIYTSAPPENVVISHLNISGCLDNGIFLGTPSTNFDDSTVVDSCTIRTVGYRGILASTVRNCVAVDCGGVAIDARHVYDSRGESIYDAGISANSAQNCYGAGNAGVLASVYAVNCWGLGLDDGDGISTTTAENCFGYSDYGVGINATDAQNCHAYSAYYTALIAKTALNCHAMTEQGLAIAAANAQNCYGYGNTNGSGMNVGTAQSCSGVAAGRGYGISAQSADTCLGQSNTGDGLFGVTVQNCIGSSSGATNFGLHAIVANNSRGYNYSSGTGLWAEHLATGCSGFGASGVGLSAYIGNSCIGTTTSGTADAVTHKYNMP